MNLEKLQELQCRLMRVKPLNVFVALDIPKNKGRTTQKPRRKPVRIKVRSARKK
jgi:hypothetical protein